jgi:hypothetical protein
MFKEYLLIPVDLELLKMGPEIGHLAPLIFTGAALFLSIVTLNKPLAYFAASSAEASLFYKLISSLSAFIATPANAETEQSPGACRSYFQTLTSSRFKWILGNGLVPAFPNYALYYLSFAAAYFINGMLAFSEEASNMGPRYSNRPYIALLGSTLFIILYMLYLYVYGCDGFLSLFFTILLGLLVGFLISFQNIALFDKSSVSVLFIPPLVKRSGMDYICVTTQTSS